MNFSYSKPSEHSDMLKQGGCFINPFFPIYKAIFYGHLHIAIINRQVQQEDWWDVVQLCCLTGSDKLQHEAKLEPDLEERVDMQWKETWILGKILIQLNPPNYLLLYCQKTYNPQHYLASRITRSPGALCPIAYERTL